MKSLLEGTFPLFRRHDGFFNFWFAAFLGDVLPCAWPDHFLHTSKKGIEARFIIYGEPLT